MKQLLGSSGILDGCKDKPMLPELPEQKYSCYFKGVFGLGQWNNSIWRLANAF